MRSIRRGLLFVLPLWAVGCSPILGQGQPEISDQAGFTLQAGTSLGQTFVARHAGLQAIDVFLRPGESGDGVISLHLRAAPDEPMDLALATIPTNAVSEPGFYRFDLTPQAGSGGEYYYALLEVEGEGSVAAPAGPADGYLHGAAYRNGQPIDAQLTFLLGYSPTHAAVGLAREALSSLAILGVGLLLFVIPGLGLVATVFRGKDSPGWTSLVALSPGVSLALYPVLILWTGLLGLRLGALYAWIPVLLGLALLTWHWRGGLRPPSIRRRTRQWIRSESFWADLALIIVVALIFIVRFYVVRPLEAPMWGDSYQHTMITQLLVQNRGLFDSWEPYAELQSFTYHFGFHAAAASFKWIIGSTSANAVLWVGQILNGLAALALYPLGLRVGGNRWAGVAAVLIAGLLAPMPMYYVNWGRYTQLAGQVILPAAVYLVWLALEREAIDRPLTSLAAVTLGGLALTHYRVFIFGALFLPAVFVLTSRNGRMRLFLGRSLLLVLGTAAIFLPWLIHVFAGNIPNIFVTQLTTPSDAVPAWLQQYNAIGDVSFYLPLWLWILLPLSLLWGLWRRRIDVAVLGLWSLLVLLAANPQWLYLPGEGAISNFAVLIAAYIPAGLAGGAAFGWMMESLGAKRIAPWLPALLLMVLAVWGARERLGDVREVQHTLVTRPDSNAMAWIRDRTPQNAKFLVNSFFAFGSSAIVGSDGGWWIPLLADRENSVPPLNYTSEQGPQPDYYKWVNDLTRQIQDNGVDDPEVLSSLFNRGFTHIYIGQRQGRVNYNGPHVLDPQLLLSSSKFRPVYHEDRVWVFEIVGGP